MGFSLLLTGALVHLKIFKIETGAEKKFRLLFFLLFFEVFFFSFCDDQIWGFVGEFLVFEKVS